MEQLQTLCLATLTGCAVLSTITLWLTARDLRRVLARMQRAMPACEDTVEQARRALRELRHVLSSTQHTARRVDGVVERVCETAAVGFSQLAAWKDRMAAMLAGHDGNGTGSRRSRRHSQGS